MPMPNGYQVLPLCLRRSWQRHGEGAPHLHLALYSQRLALRLDKLFGDGQPQPAPRALIRVAPAIKASKEMRQIGRPDAAPDFPAVREVQIAVERFFGEDELTREAKVTVLGPALAEEDGTPPGGSNEVTPSRGCGNPREEQDPTRRPPQVQANGTHRPLDRRGARRRSRNRWLRRLGGRDHACDPQRLGALRGP